MKLYKTGDDWGDFVIFQGTESECEKIDVDATSKKMDEDFERVIREHGCEDDVEEQVIWEKLVQETDFYERNLVKI